eukprot:TRINITY_DN21506_c0_g1_i1.p1 TRINITY_DN21506_c0_g1~~TRINITY_DN21506_c0_g1_i1.p1  ORF type:complete len:207 (-),score=50.61 TRINITY_DN21506_c0_g1_i1:62-589(-)
MVNIPPGVDIVTEIRKREKEQQERDMQIIEQIEQQARDMMEVYDGAAEVLRFLEHKGIKKAVLTKNSPRAVQRLVELTNVNFDCMITRESGIPNKPSPLPVFHICEKLQVDPKNTIVVGDYCDDVQCGVNAGSTSILFDPENKANSEWSVGACCVISSLLQLKNIIHSMNEENEE